MYISQKPAIKILRNKAGFTIAKATAEVKKLTKYPDGKLLKVKSADLDKIINEANQPTPDTVKPILKRRKCWDRLRPSAGR